MSGIAGLYYPQTPKPVDPARVVAMAAAQAHRGPDGSGVWTASGVGLGHCRLSVIDLAGGAQPMATVDQGVVVTCDGEIYNFREMRAELEALGARFQTESDTEVLLHGWRAWGAGMLERLNGVFAFALYDANRRSLFLARDRFGVKPLHHVELSDGAIAFASELKGLLAHPSVRRQPDFRAVEDYLGLGYVPDDSSLIAGVKKLPAAHFLLLERGKPIPQPVRWWDLDFSKRASGKPADLAAELVGRMRAAVRSHMVADVPLGAFLSGGVSSAGVVALMAEASRKAIKTSTIGFDQPDRDETTYAQLIADRFATQHRARTVPPDDFTLIDTLVAAFDEPFADASALATYRLWELARESMTVALAGDGADDVFAGYRRYRSFAAGERVRRLFPRALRSGVLGTLGEGGEFAYPKVVGVTAPALRQQLYSAAARRVLGDHRAEQRYTDTMRLAPARDPLDRAQYADIIHALPGNILTKVDRISMAVGLEAREPLLDNSLVQFAATLPPALRIRAGQGKWLMRRALEPYLPKATLSRPKLESAVPVGAWLRGALAEQAALLARSPTLSATGWFDATAIERLANDHRVGRADHGRTLWQLLMLERSVRRLFS